MECDEVHPYELLILHRTWRQWVFNSVILFIMQGASFYRETNKEQDLANIQTTKGWHIWESFL